MASDVAKFKFIVRRLRRKEEAIHAPRGVLKDDCYLGTLVHVLNVYERCGHACSYCYSEWPWSPINVVVRSNIVDRIRRDLEKRYIGKSVVLNLGSATDPYQPIEEKFKFMREIIPLLKLYNVSFYLCTKSSLVLRDLDLIEGYDGCWVAVSLASLDEDFADAFEPNATKPSERLKIIEQLIDKNILTIVRISPIMPQINDNEGELRRITCRLKEIGVKYVTADVLKLDRMGLIMERMENKPSWKRNLAESLDLWSELKGKRLNLAKTYRKIFYEEGETLHGWKVPRETYRLKVLEKLRNLCEPEIRFSTCAMGKEIKQKLDTWIENGTYRCACLAKNPKKISHPIFSK